MVDGKATVACRGTLHCEASLSKPATSGQASEEVAKGTIKVGPETLVWRATAKVAETARGCDGREVDLCGFLATETWETAKTGPRKQVVIVATEIRMVLLVYRDLP